MMNEKNGVRFMELGTVDKRDGGVTGRETHPIYNGLSAPPATYQGFDFPICPLLHLSYLFHFLYSNQS